MSTGQNGGAVPSGLEREGRRCGGVTAQRLLKVTAKLLDTTEATGIWQTGCFGGFDCEIFSDLRRKGDLNDTY